MIMPTKIIQPVDSLISISSFVLDILKKESMSLDDLLDRLNEQYYKKISIFHIILFKKEYIKSILYFILNINLLLLFSPDGETLAPCLLYEINFFLL